MDVTEEELEKGNEEYVDDYNLTYIVIMVDIELSCKVSHAYSVGHPPTKIVSLHHCVRNIFPTL